MHSTTADNKRFILVMLDPHSEGGCISYKLCSAEAGAWVLTPFDPALVASGIHHVEEMPPASVVQALIDCGDWSLYQEHTVFVTSGSPANDRAQSVRGTDFKSLLALVQHIQANGFELMGEYSGVVC